MIHYSFIFVFCFYHENQTQDIYMEHNEIKLMNVSFGGISIEVPQIWNVETEMYTEPDGRECAMIDIEAGGSDPRLITISYGPMPEGSDALVEAAGTYEEYIGETSEDEDPIAEYDFLGTTAFGFECPTEDEGIVCNFICADVNGRLVTVMTTAASYEDIDDLLDLIEENIRLA